MANRVDEGPDWREEEPLLGFLDALRRGVEGLRELLEPAGSP